MIKLSPKKIKEAKKLIKKLNIKPNIESSLEPVFDEIYFKGLEFLSKN